MPKPARLTATQIKRLRDQRAAKKLTVAQLAVAIGVTPTTVYRWERGETYPTGLAAASLEHVLPGVLVQP